MPGTTLTTKESIEPQISHDLRKRWFRILPAVFVTYSLAYLDRANYGFGAAAGLAATLNITKSRAALLGAIFFLGYFLFQVPGAAYARKKSARHLITGVEVLLQQLPAKPQLAVDAVEQCLAYNQVQPNVEQDQRDGKETDI